MGRGDTKIVKCRVIGKDCEATGHEVALMKTGENYVSSSTGERLQLMLLYLT